MIVKNLGGVVCVHAFIFYFLPVIDIDPGSYTCEAFTESLSYITVPYLLFIAVKLVYKLFRGIASHFDVYFNTVA